MPSTSPVQDVLYVVENSFEQPRYYWSLKALVTAFVGRYAHPRSNVTVFVRNGTSSVPAPSMDMLLAAQQEGIGLSTRAEQNAVIRKHVRLIEQALAG